MLRTVSTNEDRNYEDEALPSTVFLTVRFGVHVWVAKICTCFIKTLLSDERKEENILYFTLQNKGTIKQRPKDINLCFTHIRFPFHLPHCNRHADMSFNKFNSDRK